MNKLEQYFWNLPPSRQLGALGFDSDHALAITKEVLTYAKENAATEIIKERIEFVQETVLKILEIEFAN